MMKVYRRTLWENEECVLFVVPLGTAKYYWLCFKSCYSCSQGFVFNSLRHAVAYAEILLGYHVYLSPKSKNILKSLSRSRKSDC